MGNIEQLQEYIPIAKIFSLFQMEENAVILESTLINQLGKYSIIGRQPYMKVVKKNGLWVNDCLLNEEFSAFMKNYLKESAEVNPTGLPIINGAIGFYSYDFGSGRNTEFPESIFMFYDQFIIEDHDNKAIYLIANGRLQDGDSAIKELQEMITGISDKAGSSYEKADIIIKPDFEKDEYKKAINDMIQYIIEGDIYIANLTQRLDISSSKKPYELYSALRISNPAPFAAYMNYKGLQIVSASPERFLKMTGRKVMTRPIKGTRKRGATEAEDMALKLELSASDKEKSELLMIVDLERNDLNRVCIPGSVKADELFTIETYATVHHLVSNVSGELSAGLTVVDLIDATFPGGSITGAPKIRAMEIIEELERGPRGLYTGCIGYISLNGDCDFSIVIRTAVYQNGIYSLGVGGGITCESDLEFEYEETLQKARAFIEALS